MNDFEFSSNEFSDDSIFHGNFRILQPKEGYRFSVDPVLLVDFVENERFDTALDVGAGVGIIGLLLKYKKPNSQITLIELQKRLASLCRYNAARNQLQVGIIEGDFLDESLKQNRSSFDLILSCPPYYKAGAGGMCQNQEEAIARHEVRLPLSQFIAVSQKWMTAKGSLAFIYPTWRLPDVWTALGRYGLRPVRIRFVHSQLTKESCRVLIMATKNSNRELQVESPLILRDEAGFYTREARKILGE